jgi:hypothetical protein
MDKTKLQLKVINGSRHSQIPAPRLCDICGNGAILRGHTRGTQARETQVDDLPLREEVICLFLGRVIEIDVAECNRFVDRHPSPINDAGAQVLETAWVA